jgi:hypothetical protein
MTRKCQVRFGGGFSEKGRQRYLAGSLPYSIRTELVQIPTETNQRIAICTAVVMMEKDGHERAFTGIGDASPANVAPAMQLCLIRMAETRAKARALRDAVNIGVAAFEEMNEDDAYDGAPERGYPIGTGRPRSGVVGRTNVQRPQNQMPVRTPVAATGQGGMPQAKPDEPNPVVGHITDSQINAVRNLCRRVGVEADSAAMKKFKVESLAQLTQAQAGELIKSLSAQQNGRHAGVVA